jgi:hypothetical protein
LRIKSFENDLFENVRQLVEYGCRLQPYIGGDLEDHVGNEVKGEGSVVGWW